MGEVPPRNHIDKFFNALVNVVDGPVVWFREKVVANQQQYNWYHRKFRRVPTIDECYTDDPVCFVEANQQFFRDKSVDSQILSILRHRYEDCMLYEYPNVDKCTTILQQYQDASENWFIKYGDLGGYGNVKGAYMKQKHRLIWERRHGPVGSGMHEGAVME